MNNEVVITLITDLNYAMQTSVVISSILANKDANTICRIFVLTKDFDDLNRTKLENMSLNNFYVKTIPLNNDFRNIENNTKWNNIIFDKFKIPFIFKDYDKVIFLDADTVINSDLLKLYNTNLGDNYLGVVQDITLVLQDKLYPIQDSYFNAGMILFNSKKIRNDYIQNDFVKFYLKNKEKCLCPEQDTFNYLFGHKIVHLPLKYQYIILYDYYLKNNLTKFYSIKNKKDIKEENITIFHYVTLNPWKYFNTPYVKLWDKYHKLSPYFKPLKRKFYNPLFNIYRRVRYNYRFFKFKKELFFNYIEDNRDE